MLRGLTAKQSLSRIQNASTFISPFASLQGNALRLGDESSWVLHHSQRSWKILSSMESSDLSTLKSRVGPVRSRRAVLSDVAAMWNLLQDPFKEGTVLPISFDHLCVTVSDFVIYYVGSEIGGFAATKHYGTNTAELCKIVTNPIFRGRGIAKQLVTQSIFQALDEGLDSVFALSLNPTMIHIFKSLGFREVARETLPKDWQKSYDFSRRSTGVQFQLTKIPIRSSRASEITLTSRGAVM